MWKYLMKCTKKLDTKHRESYLSTTEDKNGCLIGSIKLSTQKGFFHSLTVSNLHIKNSVIFTPSPSLSSPSPVDVGFPSVYCEYHWLMKKLL